MENAPLDALPDELVLHLLQNSELQGVNALCRSNKKYTAMCDEVAKKALSSEFNNYYELYVKLQLLNVFHITVSTYEGQVEFGKVRGAKNISKKVMSLVKQLGNKDIQLKETTFKLNHQRYPTTIVMELHNDGNEEEQINNNYNIIITGYFNDNTQAEKVMDDIMDELDDVE
jgi:hypothetical protein